MNSLQSNATVVADIRKHGYRMRNLVAIPEMLEWFRKAGFQPDDFNSLNAIHIAGTKGKGSTAAFVSSILKRYAESCVENGPKKIGLFTSPHIRFVRERIQLQSDPI